MENNCAWCGHEKSDHKVEPPMRASYKTKPGDNNAVIVKTSNRKPFCHVALCTCLEYVS